MQTDPTTGEIFERPPLINLSHSPAIGKIGAALAEAQAEIDNVLKGAENPHFKSRYADLGSILTEARPKLAKAKIALIQSPYNDGENIGVETMLLHASGEWIKGSIAVKPVKFDAQGAGSVITYLRRYSLSAMLGIGSDDDDGEAAVGRPAASTKPAAKGPDPKETAAREASKKLGAMIKAAPHETALESIQTQHKADFDLVREQSQTAYDWLMEAIEKRRIALNNPPLMSADEASEI